MKAISLLLLSLGVFVTTSLMVPSRIVPVGEHVESGAAAGAKESRRASPDDPPAEVELVRKITTVEHLGRTHFRISNATATFLYDPVAGGFSSIVDKQGNDWVAYRDDATPGYPAAAATAYRGVPNLVFGGDDDGAGHPGFARCESRVTRRNQITTVSRSGEWEWQWTFYRTSARLDVIRAPADRAYWFLYEGPPGGTYRPRSTFWATDLTDPSFVIHDHYQGDVRRGQFQYMFFGETSSPYVFFMAQTTADTHADHISYLGNEEIGAADSPDGMVVAGFGRAAGATPLLQGPNTFLIGLANHLASDPLATIRTRRRLGKLIAKRGR